MAPSIGGADKSIKCSHIEKNPVLKRRQKNDFLFIYIYSEHLAVCQTVCGILETKEWMSLNTIYSESIWGKQTHKQLLIITWIIFMTDAEGQFKQRDQG